MSRAYKHNAQRTDAVATVVGVNFELVEIDASSVERLRDPALALHRHEIAVQPDIADAPARADEPFWELYSSRFAGWITAGNGFCLIAERSDGEVLGVGRALMNAARDRFRERGYSHFELSTVPSNEDARAFYSRLGMRQAAVLMLGEV